MTGRRRIVLGLTLGALLGGGMALAPAAPAQEATGPSPAEIAALANLTVCGDCSATDDVEAQQCQLHSPVQLLAHLPRGQ